MAHRHGGKHVIDQMSGTLGHPAATTARTKTTTLAREGHQSIEPASVAMKPRESRRQAAASEKVPKFLIDEPRQAFPVSKGRRLGAERLEVLEDDAVEHALRGTARLVRRRWRGHVNGRGRHVPGCESSNPA